MSRTTLALQPLAFGPISDCNASEKTAKKSGMWIEDGNGPRMRKIPGKTGVNRQNAIGRQGHPEPMVGVSNPPADIFTHYPGH